MRLSDKEIIEAFLLLAVEALGSFLAAALSDVLDFLASRRLFRVALSELPGVAVPNSATTVRAAHTKELQLS